MRHAAIATTTLHTQSVLRLRRAQLRRVVKTTAPDATRHHRYYPPYQCSVCGGLALLHSLDALPCRYRGERYERAVRPTHRESGGSTREATELIQGFLWVGNVAAGRRRSLDELLITHVVNCAGDLPNECDDDDDLAYKRVEIVDAAERYDGFLDAIQKATERAKHGGGGGDGGDEEDTIDANDADNSLAARKRRRAQLKRRKKEAAKEAAKKEKAVAKLPAIGKGGGKGYGGSQSGGNGGSAVSRSSSA